MNMSFPMRRALRLCLLPLTVAALTACGGWWDEEEDSSSGSSATGALTFSASSPATHNTTADPTKAVNMGNDARAADTFSSTPYCDVYWEDFTAANGKHYALQVYFRQSDKQVLHASLIDATGGGAPGFVAFDNAAGAPISGVTVNTTARTVTFTNKVLNGSGGATATVNGTTGFAANKAAAACGN